MCELDDPKTFDEAMKRENNALWKEAIKAEFQSMIKKRSLDFSEKSIKSENNQEQTGFSHKKTRLMML